MEKAEADKAHEEAAQKVAAMEVGLNERKVGLDAYEEELAARGAELAATLRGKDDEIQALVSQQTQELERKHNEAIEAQAIEHAKRIKEPIDAAEVAKVAKTE